jgi:hypothetical protein
VRYGMKVQLVIPYRVTPLQRYEVTLHGNVTSVYLLLSFRLVIDSITPLQYSVNVRAGRKVLLKSVCMCVCVCVYTHTHIHTHTIEIHLSGQLFPDRLGRLSKILQN